MLARRRVLSALAGKNVLVSAASKPNRGESQQAEKTVIGYWLLVIGLSLLGPTLSWRIK